MTSLQVYINIKEQKHKLDFLNSGRKLFSRAIRSAFLLISLFQLIVIIPTGNSKTYFLPDDDAPQDGRYQTNEKSNSTSKHRGPVDGSLMLIGGTRGDFDIDIWKDWIVAWKGWSEGQWGAFLNQWNDATDLRGKNQILAYHSIQVFTWGASNLDQALKNAETLPTRDMVEQLAEDTADMPNVSLIGWSKGGNLVLHYLDQLAEGKLDNAVTPDSVILLAPATHPFLALHWWKADLVDEKIPEIVPKAVSFCSGRDGVCSENINGALNIDPAGYYSDDKYHGPFGLYAQETIDYIYR